MIIYGWGSFNRRDHSVVRGQCQSCSRRGYLRSYTASRFFTLYFIPVIPIGKQKVLRECPHCKATMGMSYRSWMKSKKKDLPAALAAYESSPTAEQPAKELLTLIYNVQDAATLKQVGPRIRSAFAQNADVITHLAGTYSHLCMDKEADEAYLAAVALSSDEDIAKEANTHLELQKQVPPKPRNRLLQSLPVLIVPGALLFLFSLFAQRTISSKIEDAYVLSGLSQPYSAVINGETVSLRAFQRLPGGMLVYGENTIEPTSESPFIPRQTFHISTPWHKRAFGGPTVVVNPDQAAVVLWERTGYALPSPPEHAYSYGLATGRSSYVYEDIDFAFQEFPDTVEMSKSSSIVYRQRVSVLPIREPVEIAQTLLGNELPDELTGYLRAVLRAGSTDATAIHLGATFLPADEFIALAEPRLSDRPVSIEWHRAYQTVAGSTGETSTLVAQYRNYVNEFSQDPSLVYLLARILEDPDQTREMLMRATELPNPTGYAANALAYHSILEGDLASAITYADMACQIAPDIIQFQQMRVTARYGAGDFATIEAETGDLLAAGNLDYREFYDHLYRLAKLGRDDDARDEIKRFLDRLDQQSPLTDVDRLSGSVYLESAVAIALKDGDAFAAIAAAAKDPAWDFQNAIITGNLDAALQYAATHGNQLTVPDRMTLFILLSRSSREQEAEEQLQEIQAQLSAGSRDERRWAEWLDTDTAPDLKVAAHTCPDVDNHCLYLATLAARHPKQSEEYLARASAVKIRDSFYTLAIADFMNR